MLEDRVGSLLDCSYLFLVSDMYHSVSFFLLSSPSTILWSSSLLEVIWSVSGQRWHCVIGGEPQPSDLFQCCTKTATCFSDTKKQRLVPVVHETVVSLVPVSVVWVIHENGSGGLGKWCGEAAAQRLVLVIHENGCFSDTRKRLFRWYPVSLVSVVHGMVVSLVHRSVRGKASDNPPKTSYHGMILFSCGWGAPRNEKFFESRLKLWSSNSQPPCPPIHHRCTTKKSLCKSDDLPSKNTLLEALLDNIDAIP